MSPVRNQPSSVKPAAVAEVAVAGVADAEWGEVVAAWVVPAPVGPPPEAAELTGFVAERLARFKCPRRFVFVEALPRNALGKLLRHELQGDVRAPD